ncbi:rho guanine nucleotide exchange factor 12-like isoform X5 [Oratosquilla oratoria]|uniref:rho guanine nucleotide exchange factor 12-like isoform X5 n=1 Tax=Oratosquilla oratoria TaxID=337810 RepID=UPI003F775760
MDERLEAIAEGEDLVGQPGDPNGLRTVVIHRGERGYGLTVSGESPVTVQDVKDGGPAAQAGVKKGDSIIRVNGTLVSQVNHKEVVQIIKSTQYVKLTLQSCPEGELPASLVSSQDPTHRPLPPTPTNKTNERITAPLPVTSQLQNQLEMQRVKMLHVYLDKQCKVRDSILAELERGTSKNLQRNFEKELDSINRQIAKITEELKNMKDIEGQSASTADSSTRPPSHYRAKSSPDPLGQQANPGTLRLSDSLSDLSSVGIMSSGSRSKVSSVVGDETFVGEPPGTPPPPYSSTTSSCTSSLLKLPSSQEEGDENYSIIQEDSEAGDGEFAPSAPPLSPAPPLPSRPTLPGVSKAGSQHNSPHSSRVTSPTTSNGQAGTPTNPLLSPGLWSPVSSSIMCMEDDEFSDPEPMEDHGPFQSLSKLCRHKAYLAVFINYVISNCDSSSLFFYLITDLYKEGIGKEMKRWAYEIHSSFLLPGAPLRLSNIDESVLREIDQTLQHESDKEEILRKVFWKARQRSREDLNELLADFRSKRNAGLGSIFGPPDHLLEESIHNKTKELSIVDHLLAPCLESVSDDLKNATDQMFVMASSLATILYKYFNVRSQQTQNLIDRCPLFVGKERPIRPKIFRGNKKTIMFCDHHFNVQSYYSVTYCNHCGLIIWGIAPQGYQCTNCEMNIHKMCAKRVEEVCIGQLRKKDSKFITFFGKIMPDDKENRRKTSQVNPSHIERARNYPDDGDFEDSITGKISRRASVCGASGSAVGCLRVSWHRSLIYHSHILLAPIVFPSPSLLETSRASVWDHNAKS